MSRSRRIDGLSHQAPQQPVLLHVVFVACFYPNCYLRGSRSSPLSSPRHLRLCVRGRGRRVPGNPPTEAAATWLGLADGVCGGCGFEDKPVFRTCVKGPCDRPSPAGACRHCLGGEMGLPGGSVPRGGGGRCQLWWRGPPRPTLQAARSQRASRFTSAGVARGARRLPGPWCHCMGGGRRGSRVFPRVLGSSPPPLSTLESSVICLLYCFGGGLAIRSGEQQG